MLEPALKKQLEESQARNTRRMVEAMADGGVIPEDLKADIEEVTRRLLEGSPPLAGKTRSSHKIGSVKGIPPRFTENPPNQVERAFIHLKGNLSDYLAQMNDTWPGYLIYGGLGVGKTGVGIMMLREGAEMKRCCLFIMLDDMVDMVKDTWGDQSGISTKQVYDYFQQPDILMVDDVGASQYRTESERNILYRILVKRYNYLKANILNTNCDLDTEEGRFDFYECVGKRVASRFEGFIVSAKTWGPNLRSQK